MKKVSTMPTKGIQYLDYARLFDGNIWQLEEADFAGRDEKLVSAAIRNAAYRERIKVSVVSDGGKLFVQAGERIEVKDRKARR